MADQSPASSRPVITLSTSLIHVALVLASVAAILALSTTGRISSGTLTAATILVALSSSWAPALIQKLRNKIGSK
jgi:hypothetical protein